MSEVEKAQCIVCTKECEPHPKGFHFCHACQDLTSGFVLMICLTCGNFQYFPKTDSVNKRLDTMRETCEIHDVYNCTCAVYDSCPKCHNKQTFN